MNEYFMTRASNRVWSRRKLSTWRYNYLYNVQRGIRHWVFEATFNNMSAMSWR